VLFTTPKTSDGPKPPTLAFRQEDVAIGYVEGSDRLIKSRRVMWDDEPVDLTADEARIANTPSQGDGRKARSASVKEFLREALRDGPVLQRVVIEHGAEKGFSLPQLRRALDAIGGKPFRGKSAGKNSPWWWRLPEHIPAGVETDEESEKETE
jgi:hypothetical protein